MQGVSRNCLMHYQNQLAKSLLPMVKPDENLYSSLVGRYGLLNALQLIMDYPLLPRALGHVEAKSSGPLL